MKEEILKLSNISKRLGYIQALEKVNVRLFSGELVFLIGAADSGKTVLLKTIAGMLTPDDGEIIIKKKHVQFSSVFEAVNMGIQYIGHEFEFLSNMTVAENIYLGCEKFDFLHAYMKKNRLLISDLCSEMNIEIDINKRANITSFSEKIKIITVRAVYCSQKLVIFDGIINTLNNEELHTCIEMLYKLKGRGISVIISDISLDMAMLIADRIVCMNKGSIVADVPRLHADMFNLENIFITDSEIVDRSFEYTNEYGAKLFELTFADKTIPVKQGEVVGIYAGDEEKFSFYMEQVFKPEKIGVNIKSDNADIMVLRLENMKECIFPEMSITDNMLLPAVDKLFGRMWLNDKNMTSFAYTESEKLLNLSKKDMGEHIKNFGIQVSESVVLLRSIFMGADIIILAGIIEEWDPRLNIRLQRFLKIAAEKSKTIVLAASKKSMLYPFTSHIEKI